MDIGGDLRGRQYQIATRCPPVIVWHPAIYSDHPPAPLGRHVESQSLESQPEGRTLCTAWQGFLSVGAEERRGAQKAAPGTPHGRYRHPPPFRAVMGAIKMGPVPTADHAATAGPTGRSSPLGLGEPVYLLFIRKAVASAMQGGGVKMSRYWP